MGIFWKHECTGKHKFSCIPKTRIKEDMQRMLYREYLIKAYMAFKMWKKGCVIIKVGRWQRLIRSQKHSQYNANKTTNKMMDKAVHIKQNKRLSNTSLTKNQEWPHVLMKGLNLFISMISRKQNNIMLREVSACTIF